VSRGISDKEVKLRCLSSGGLCAFPGCEKRLIRDGSSVDDPIVIGEIAHIIAESRSGPRGDAAFSDEDRSKHTNLILLCPEHHTIIDRQPNTYSIPVLRQMKADHEGRISALGGEQVMVPVKANVRENIYCTLLPLTHLPDVVFAAPSLFTDGQDEELRKRLRWPSDRDEMTPFLLREGKLFAFHDLRSTAGPFSEVVDRDQVETLRATRLWSEPEGSRRYVSLLNGALRRYTGRRGVRFDPLHKRYYFAPTDKGKERSVTYRSLSGRRVSRKVVWRPIRRSTAEPRNFWWHLAAGLRFHLMGEKQWCLSVRPERHLTVDGETPLAAERIGPRVTSLKAHMYNDLYLSEVNFWREYLSAGKPRAVLKLGKQSAVIDTRLLGIEVIWPGIPGDEKPFRNEAHPEDLFTFAEFKAAIGGDGDIGMGEEPDDDAEG
jgi:hypothetical protein